MSEFTGKKIRVRIYGASHDPVIGVEIEGLAGQVFHQEKVQEYLARRKAKAGVYSTSRLEADLPEIQGVEQGVIGKTFRAEIHNANVKSGDYSALYGKPRPSHADYAWYLKESQALQEILKLRE